ncbi:CHAP domain containing protein, putative [Leishmania lindenbergi]|uniref:CHAP domain containing protein n=1 Tax=Leishmania lindenbergi TaxID=651832 RepID=A0AAW3A0E7_9TRYP
MGGATRFISSPGASTADDDVVVRHSCRYGGATIQRNTSCEIDNERTLFVQQENKRTDSGVACLGAVRRFVLTRDPLLYGLLKWGLSVLLLLFLTFILLGLFFSVFFYRGNCENTNGTTKGKTDPKQVCVTPFGAILGVYAGVFGYSNCNDDYTSTKYRYVNLTVPVLNKTGNVVYTSKSFFTGLEWQCVEFARRFWMLSGKPEGAYFDSVVGAADIWNLTFVRLVSNTSTTLPLQKYSNGGRISEGLQAPAPGDIIIYPVQGGGFPYGHVAVITKVDMAMNGAIYVAEQNWGSAMWVDPHHNYSRRIPLLYDMTTSSVTLNDPNGTIIGWMRYG